MRVKDGKVHRGTSLALVIEALVILAAIAWAVVKSLERQWSRGQDVSTEDLRAALTRYRSFFDRLLSV